MPRPRRTPWYAVDVDIRTNEKIVGLPSDSARLGWIAAVLAEAKRQKRPGQFASRAHLAEAIGRFGRYIAAYTGAGLLEPAPRLCDRCRVDFGPVPTHTLVVHDWWRKQRDPTHAERQAAYASKGNGVHPDAESDAVTDAESDANPDADLAHARRTTATETVDSSHRERAPLAREGLDQLDVAVDRACTPRAATRSQQLTMRGLARRLGTERVIAELGAHLGSDDPFGHALDQLKAESAGGLPPRRGERRHPPGHYDDLIERD